MRTIPVIPWLDIATARQYNLLREDARAASYFLARESLFVDLNLTLEEWFFYTDTWVRLDISTQVVWPFVAPVVNERIDLISINALWVVVVTPWVEAGSPVEPTLPTGNLPVAAIYFRQNSTAIYDKVNDTGTDAYIMDRRMFLNMWWGGWSWNGTKFVDIIFDDNANDLPATTATLIDWETVLDWRLCYVKDCSDWLKIWNIYSATVVAWNITWNFVETIPAWTWIYSDNWAIYNNTTIIWWDTTVVNINNFIVNSWWTIVVNGSYVSEDFTFTGAENSYTLSETPIDWNSILIFVDWELPRLLWVWKDYTVAGKDINFTYTPDANTFMQFKFLKALSTTQQQSLYWFKTITWVLTAWLTTIINDTDILATSPFNVYFDWANPPAWNVTWVATAWTITLTSTAVETWGQPYTIVLFASQTQNFLSPTWLDTSVIYTSSPFNWTGSPIVITHNLNVTEADVEAWRYTLMFTYTYWWSWRSWLVIKTTTWAVDWINFWLATNPAQIDYFHRQANTVTTTNVWVLFTNIRVRIKQNR